MANPLINEIARALHNHPMFRRHFSRIYLLRGEIQHAYRDPEDGTIYISASYIDPHTSTVRQADSVPLATYTGLMPRVPEPGDEAILFVTDGDVSMVSGAIFFGRRYEDRQAGGEWNPRTGESMD